jgi:hypothetical protein
MCQKTLLTQFSRPARASQLFYFRPRLVSQHVDTLIGNVFNIFTGSHINICIIVNETLVVRWSNYFGKTCHSSTA